ncbi:MAG: hypothetical protein ACE5FA_13975 [Dehalococcoidia bacterium]
MRRRKGYTTTHKGGYPARQRLLFCLGCDYVFMSGHFYCPSCLSYDFLMNATRDVLVELALTKNQRAIDLLKAIDIGEKYGEEP